jgi:hypothetical protein
MSSTSPDRRSGVLQANAAIAASTPTVTIDNRLSMIPLLY